MRAFDVYELGGSSVIFSDIQLLGARARNQHLSHSCTERWTRAGFILIATVSRRAKVSANSVPKWQQKCQQQPRLIKGSRGPSDRGTYGAGRVSQQAAGAESCSCR